MAAVTVLGLGAMGSRMALALLRGGHAVTVWNRTTGRANDLAAHGAKVASSPSAAVTNADFVIAMVRDDEASASVWLDEHDGALAAMPVSAIGVDSSTLTSAWVVRLADRFYQAGRAFLDAPVAGSRPQADAGQLIYFVGGDAGVLAKAEPVLRQIGGAVHHAGPVGAGTAVKLAVNTLFAVQVAALAEVIAGLDASGADVARALEIFSTTPVCSPAAGAAAASMLARNFAPLFPVDLMEKDLGYALATGGVPARPITAAARQAFADAKRAGLGDEHLTALVKLYAKGANDA